MAGRWLTELQGVTIDFWGGPQLHLWPQGARPTSIRFSPDVPKLRDTESTAASSQLTAGPQGAACIRGWAATNGWKMKDL